MYFPLSLTNKISSASTENRVVLFKYCLFRGILGVFVGLVPLIISGTPIRISAVTILTSALFGIMLAVCMFLTVYSMQVTSVAISSVFISGSVNVPTLTSIIFFDEPLPVRKILGMIFFFLSIYLIVDNKEDYQKKQKFGIKALVVCVLAMLTSGFISVAMQLFARFDPEGEEAVFMFLGYSAQAVFLIIFYALFALKNRRSDDRGAKMSRLLVLCGIGGVVLSYIIQRMTTMLAATVPAMLLFPFTSASGVIVAALVARICFGERLSGKNILGIALAIVSIILVN
ncbi:MAG: DMT family transporter [Clostridia bacterium]|nr:DMT family transporter [Clostridia bacterium]